MFQFDIQGFKTVFKNVRFQVRFQDFEVLGFLRVVSSNQDFRVKDFRVKSFRVYRRRNLKSKPWNP
jgi:hypothetical protein